MKSTLSAALLAAHVLAPSVHAYATEPEVILTDITLLADDGEEEGELCIQPFDVDGLIAPNVAPVDDTIPACPAR